MPFRGWWPRESALSRCPASLCSLGRLSVSSRAHPRERPVLALLGRHQRGRRAPEAIKKESGPLCVSENINGLSFIM